MQKQTLTSTRRAAARSPPPHIVSLSISQQLLSCPAMGARSKRQQHDTLYSAVCPQEPAPSADFNNRIVLATENPSVIFLRCYMSVKFTKATEHSDVVMQSSCLAVTQRRRCLKCCSRPRTTTKTMKVAPPTTAASQPQQHHSHRRRLPPLLPATVAAEWIVAKTKCHSVAATQPGRIAALALKKKRISQDESNEECQQPEH